MVFSIHFAPATNIFVHKIFFANKIDTHEKNYFSISIHLLL